MFVLQLVNLTSSTQPAEYVQTARTRVRGYRIMPVKHNKHNHKPSIPTPALVIAVNGGSMLHPLDCIFIMGTTLQDESFN